MFNEVEYYQPAYMIGGIDLIPQRECKDRCRTIEKYLTTGAAGNRILDIGSSLGYVCYYFTDRGAITEGWEISTKNIEVARLIGQINGLPAKFKTKELSLETLDDAHIEDFDTVINLSVFHRNGKNAQVIDYGLMLPTVIDDDVISFLNVLDAIQIKCKESGVHGIKSFPSKNNFTNPYLLHLYENVENGEKSPKKLLECLKKEKGI
jgi:SAM-dependent methyltransferase